MSNTAINKQIAKGAIWMVGLRFCIKGISIVSTMILAHLLVPDDFGVMAMASSVYALIELMRSFGFDTVLIQRQTADKDHYDTAWTLQIIFAILASASIIAVSDLAASYYNDYRLGLVLSTMALVTLFNGFNNIGVVEFRKKLTFGKEFTYQLLIKLSGFVITIPLAFYWRNYWALLMGTISSTMVSLILSYLMQSYRPKISLKVWKDVLGFSSWLYINNILFFLNQHSQNFILGRMGGSNALGLFSISNEIGALVIGEIVAPINRAAYPGYSAVASDKDKLKETYLRVFSYIVIIAVPSAIGIAITSPVFVAALLGEKWSNCVPMIQIISLGSIFVALNSSSGYIYLALGKQKFTTALTILWLCILIPLMFWFAPKEGGLGVAKAILITSIIMFPFYQLWINKILSISTFKLITTIKRPLIASVAMGYIVLKYLEYIGAHYHDLAGVTYLLSIVILGASCFVFILFSLWITTKKISSAEDDLFTKLKIFLEGDSC
ncbi:MAG: lipopolysaccharide biosynthesis protein [Methylomonas sp.]|uniref:lipopolysaccharide biosynthesis protein n=1 Tax=Methylomonas sp. TaxID=418 RepID=UPI0025F76049|nr:lipopolysaccharide biosynthesis protein [Methylomonas sp.]MCK9606075.1 lipopolysaccharide biosynthesis protein [Methylomonas sp.]